MHSIEQNRALVEALSARAGFARAGTLALADLTGERALADWLERGQAAQMTYLHRHAQARLAPDQLVPGAQSVICLAAPCGGGAPGPIARFARGRDYHKVLKKRCHNLMDMLRQSRPDFTGRAFVDAGPVGERHLAATAGLGWIGRNGCLFVPGLGSHVLLAEIFCNLPLATPGPMASQCGSCRACQRACPTGALQENGQVDARRCLSYLTIEHEGAIDPPLARCLGGRIFGCDACQDACPHNRALLPGDRELTGEYWAGLGLAGPLRGAQVQEIAGWTPEDWSAGTEGSTIRRASLEQLQRNAGLALGEAGGGGGGFAQVSGPASPMG